MTASAGSGFARDVGRHVEALLALSLARAGLGISSLETLSRLLDAVPASGQAPAEPAVVLSRVRASVSRVARITPRSTCLSEALAVRLLLRRRGVGSELRLGVRRDEAGMVRAHAWVDVPGIPDAGAPSEFSPLTSAAASR